MTIGNVLLGSALGLLVAAAVQAQTDTKSNSCVSLPPGYKPLFDGKTSKGWHISRSTMHGTDMKVSVRACTLFLDHRPYGQGGVLLTDKTYGNFELYLEAKPDFHSNSGVFLRSTEGTSAYQIEIAPLDATSGDLVPEWLPMGEKTYLGEKRKIDEVWKNGEWNSIRVRMEGAAPHVSLWINGEKMWEVQLAKNDTIGGVTTGHVGLQLHMAQGAGIGPGVNSSHEFSEIAQRFRNIGIKELP